MLEGRSRAIKTRMIA